MKTRRLMGLISGLTALILTVAGLFVVVEEEMEEQKYSIDELRCSLALGRISPARGLVAGYNYDLLETFAGSHEAEIEILTSGSDTTCLDSLRQDLLDLVVMRYDSTLVLSEPLHIIQVDTMTCWVINSLEHGKVEAVEGWLDAYLGSEDELEKRDLYYFNYNPRRYARMRERPDTLSPYDAIIRAEAARIDWDWRMLAAVIWQESRFDINARSYRGALGIMQMMPLTAKHFGVDEEINPGKCIHAGAEYLQRLQRLFRKRALNSEELMKITLASYNGGQGRILQCIEYADEHNSYDGTWASIVDCIPEVENFKGFETIAYVDQVLDTYELLCQIAPDGR